MRGLVSGSAQGRRRGVAGAGPASHREAQRGGGVPRGYRGTGSASAAGAEGAGAEGARERARRDLVARSSGDALAKPPAEGVLLAVDYVADGAAATTAGGTDRVRIFRASRSFRPSSVMGCLSPAHVRSAMSRRGFR